MGVESSKRMRGVSGQLLLLSDLHGWLPRTAELLSNKLRLSAEEQADDALFGNDDHEVILSGSTIGRDGKQFTIQSEGSSQPYTFLCSNEAEAVTWCQHLAHEIQDQQTQRAAEAQRRAERKVMKAAKAAEPSGDEPEAATASLDPPTLRGDTPTRERLFSIAEEQLSIRSTEDPAPDSAPVSLQPVLQPSGRRATDDGRRATRRGGRVTFMEDPVDAVHMVDKHLHLPYLSEPQPAAKYSAKHAAQTELTEGLLSPSELNAGLSHTTELQQESKCPQCCQSCTKHCIIA